MDIAPIILFVYNRPWHTKKTVEALQKNELAELSELIIYSDGPKDTAESSTAVAEVRKYLNGVGGFKKITIVESVKNLGLANSIITGVTEVVNKYGRVIVLEDDLVTAPNFLRYMNQALERYENEEQVMQNSGYMFDVDIDAETDAVFLPITSCWGWSSWKRAWRHFDPLMSGYEKLKRDRALRHRFDLDGAYNYFNMLKAQRKGKVDSWGIRWYLSVFMMNGLTLYPARTLVKNIGFDSSGRHRCRSSLFNHTTVDIQSVSYHYNLPEPFLNYDAYNAVVQYLSSKQTIAEKLRSVFCKISGSK